MKYIVSSMPDAALGQYVTKKHIAVLTPREEEVVLLLAEGLRNRDIAARMNVSDNTVKNYLFRIFEKLGFSNRVEVVLYATARLQESATQAARA